MCRTNSWLCKILCKKTGLSSDMQRNFRAYSVSISPFTGRQHERDTQVQNTGQRPCVHGGVSRLLSVFHRHEADPLGVCQPGYCLTISAEPLLSGIGTGISGLSEKNSSTALRAPIQAL